MKKAVKILVIIIISGIILGSLSKAIINEPDKLEPTLITHQIRTITVDSELDQLTNELYAAKSGDHFVLMMNSYGGEVIALYQLLNAMSVTKATVSIVSVGAAYSAAGILLFMADKPYIAKYGSLLIHLARTQRGILPLTNGLQQDIIKLMDKAYGYLLTVDEKKRVLRGEDIFISFDTIRSRLAMGMNSQVTMESLIPEILKEQENSIRILRFIIMPASEEEKKAYI